MHELGVVFHIADIVRDVAVENKATKIQKVVNANRRSIHDCERSTH